MSTIHHTPIATNAAGDSAVVNAPLGQLDAILDDALSFAVANNVELVAARSPYPSLDARLATLVTAGSNVSTQANGVANAAQKIVVVDASAGFLHGAPVAYTLVGGAIETNTVDTVDSPTQLTLTTNIGTGGIADNTYIAVINPGSLVSTGAVPGSTSMIQQFTRGVVFGAASSVQPGTAVAAGTVSIPGLSAGTHAFADEQTIASIDIGSGYCSFDARPELADAQARTHFVGYQSRPVVNAGAGNITDYMDGYNSAMTHLGAGSIAAMHHFRVIAPVNSGGGTITAQYGLKVESLLGAGTNYGVWIGDVGNAPSYGLYNEGSTYLKANVIITPFLDLLTPNVAQDYAPLRLNGIGHGVGDETRIAWYESTAQEYPVAHIGAAFYTGSTDAFLSFATRVSGTVTEQFRVDTRGAVAVLPALSANKIGLSLNAVSATVGSELQIGFSVGTAALGCIGASFQSDSTDGYIAFGTRLASTVAEKMRLDKDGRLGVGVTAPLGKTHIDQADNAAAIPALLLDQADISEGFIDFVGATAASAAGPISSWTTGATLTGFVRVEINGAAYWMPYYSAPSS